MLESIKHKIERIEISLLETSSKHSCYLLFFDGCYYEINQNIADLINVLKRSEHYKEAEDIFEKEYGKIYSKEDIEKLINKFLIPIFNHNNESEYSNPFLWKKEFMSSISIDRISFLLKGLFNKKIICLLLIIVCGLEVCFLYNFYSPINVCRVDFYSFIAVMMLILSSSFVHELGHASACQYYGVKPGGIGVALYLNFPVFYTDVSNIWKLCRLQRLVVNFAGVYFQLLLLIPCIIIYMFTYCEYIQYFIYVVNLNLLITLNPFFKFDGYWIMSDLLGVPNLKKRTIELLVYYFSKNKNRKKYKPFLLGMKSKEKIVMLLYSFAVNVFFVYYFFYILPMFLFDFVKTFPENLEKVVIAFSSGHLPDLYLIQVVLVRFIFVAFSIYLGMQFIRKIFIAAQRKYKHKNQII